MNYKDKSNLGLIEKSAMQLYAMLSDKEINKVYMPFPGIGLGGLKEEIVLEILESILDERFILIKKSIKK